MNANSNQEIPKSLDCDNSARTVSLHSLFPDEDHRFSMRLERGDPAAFYRSTTAAGRLLAERRHWLETTPEACLAVTPEAAPMLAELIELLETWQPANHPTAAHHDPLAQCRALGHRLEPDILLGGPDESGVWRLRAGCVCFPSSWALEDKIGRPIHEIHAPVPGLNREVGPQIGRFLGRLAPGVSWQRANWGLSGSPELNQHPRLRKPRLDADVTREQVFLRIEHQSLVALPRSGGVLFGIRIEVVPIACVLSDPPAAAGLRRALRTMPAPLAGYKGLSHVLPRLLVWLESAN